MPQAGVPGTHRGTLACAQCTFVLKMVLSPQRGAHVFYLRSHEHHLGLAKLNSRLRAVRILKNEFSPSRGAHCYAHLGKSNVFGAPPDPGTPAADVPPRSRLRGVPIFEQTGALALTPCAFRFQAGFLHMTNCH